MDLSTHINQLREDLAAAASAGDEQTRNAAALLSGAMEPAARLMLMNALSDMAAEVTEQLDGQVADIRLDGRDVRVVVSGASPEHETPEQDPPTPPPSGDSGDISRITLRLLDEIKGQAEHAAATQGVSLNTWVAQAVQGALHGGRARGPWERRAGTDPWASAGQRPPGDEHGGSRIRGWVQG